MKNETDSSSDIDSCATKHKQDMDAVSHPAKDFHGPLPDKDCDVMLRLGTEDQAEHELMEICHVTAGQDQIGEHENVKGEDSGFNNRKLHRKTIGIDSNGVNIGSDSDVKTDGCSSGSTASSEKTPYKRGGPSSASKSYNRLGQHRGGCRLESANIGSQKRQIDDSPSVQKPRWKDMRRGMSPRGPVKESKSPHAKVQTRKSWSDEMDELDEEMRRNEQIKQMRKNRANIANEGERETDPVVLERRQKQIDYGKNTVSYENYTSQVTKEERETFYPHTPDKYAKCSRRLWDSRIKNWKIQLHTWAPPSDDRAKPGTNGAMDTTEVNGERKVEVKKEVEENKMSLLRSIENDLEELADLELDFL